MVIDAHAHIDWNTDATAFFAGTLAAAQIEAGYRLGIDILVCSAVERTVRTHIIPW